MNLSQKLTKKSANLNHFNATHQVQVRPIDVRDTYQNKLFHPPQVDTPVTFQTTRKEESAIPLKGPPKKQDQIQIIQIEKEMAKIRETQLADQMAFEEKFNQITLDERFQ